MFKKLARKIVKIFPKPLQELYMKYEEALWYLFFGVLTTAVSFISAWGAKYLLEALNAGDGVVSVVSTVFSWICAVTFAYVTNRLWVFDSETNSKGGILKEMIAFYGGRVFTLLVETAMMYLGCLIMGNDWYWIIKIIANVVILILNYVISKLFVFKNKKEAENEKA